MVIESFKSLDILEIDVKTIFSMALFLLFQYKNILPGTIYFFKDKNKERIFHSFSSIQHKKPSLSLFAENKNKYYTRCHILIKEL
jgi:hypothetical protein